MEILLGENWVDGADQRGQKFHIAEEAQKNERTRGARTEPYAATFASTLPVTSSAPGLTATFPPRRSKTG